MSEEDIKVWIPGCAASEITSQASRYRESARARAATWRPSFPRNLSHSMKISSGRPKPASIISAPIFPAGGQPPSHQIHAGAGRLFAVPQRRVKLEYPIPLASIFLSSNFEQLCTFQGCILLVCRRLIFTCIKRREPTLFVRPQSSGYLQAEHRILRIFTLGGWREALQILIAPL